ncbi:MAG: TIGR02466 family protein [Methylococcales bacterium]
MEKNLSILFGMPLWKFQAEDKSALNEALLKSIIKEKKTDLGVKLSNQGGWQSHGKLHFKKEFRMLVDTINKYLPQVGKDYGFGVASAKLKVTSMWVNVNTGGSSNAVHSHQSPSGMPNPLVLSGCYYIKVPENSGQFVLEDFSRPMRYLQLPFQEPNLMNSFTIKLPPKEGDLLFFPAWMEHSVEVNNSKDERISIAFNVAIITMPAQK